MELKPGMYVRTKYGIFKIRKITKDLAYWKHEKRVLELDRNIPEYNYRFSFYKDESIFKGAKFKDNIIDLIEVGDIVKLFMEDDIDKEDTDIFELVAVTTDKKQIGVFNSDFQIEFFPIENLRGILTKEQFSQMEYKVEQ